MKNIKITPKFWHLRKTIVNIFINIHPNISPGKDIDIIYNFNIYILLHKFHANGITLYVLFWNIHVKYCENVSVWINIEWECKGGGSLYQSPVCLPYNYMLYTPEYLDDEMNTSSFSMLNCPMHLNPEWLKKKAISSLQQVNNSLVKVCNLVNTYC